PTLIFHRRGDQVVRFALGQELAARVPNARFVPLEGMDAAPSAEQFQEQLQVIHSFLRPRSRGRSPLAASVSKAETSTILFTDVEGSTALTDQMGDAEARQLLRQHERITRQALKAHGGSEVKAMGDGFMASFGSATKALECAAAIQGNMAATEVRVRIGLNAGERKSVTGVHKEREWPPRHLERPSPSCSRSEIPPECVMRARRWRRWTRSCGQKRSGR